MNAMMRQAAALGAGLAAISGAAARADVTPNALFTDGAVLQREMPVPVFGTARAGEKVTVTFGKQTVSAVAGGDGRWEARLAPVKAGGPYEMTIAGDNTVTVKNVLVGEVYVASGQSNMEFGLGGAANAAEVIPQSADPELRMFTVQKATSDTPLSDVRGVWKESNPANAGGFSAVGYFFARDLRRALKVPVGIIHTSWGGTRAEAWTSRPSLTALNQTVGGFDVAPRPAANLASAQAAYEKRLAEWKAAGSHEGPVMDAGNTGFAAGWAKPDFADDKDWKTMTLPAAWEFSGQGLENLDGVVWFRREVDVPAANVGKDLTLSLGAIDDADTTYFNGVQVGSTGTDMPTSWTVPRVYKIPGSLVKAGKNTVAVRVFDAQGGGGLTGPTPLMRLRAGSDIVASLDGEWRYVIEQRILSKPVPPNANNPNAPSVLYNAMIAPLIPYAVKGAIWYQGESNAGNPKAYASLFPAMITDWRKQWGEGDFPFFFVQLAPFQKIVQTPQESNWAGLREAQRLTLEKLPKTGMAVITDVGEENDIHPKRKEPVGHRLALAALQTVYGKKDEGSGPVFEKMTVDGSNIILHFSHVGGGLVASPDGPLTGFALKGDDGKWVAADAKIVGKTVVVSSPAVAHPVAARFGWADYPVVNLSNQAGIPASPFTTEGLGG